MASTTEEICNTATETTYTLENLEPCTVYFVSVATISTSGKHSSKVHFSTNSNIAGMYEYFTF